MAQTILGTIDVALRLGCSAERVRQLERAGRLRAEKTPGGRRVFRGEDVDRLLEERLQMRKQTKGNTESGAAE